MWTSRSRIAELLEDVMKKSKPIRHRAGIPAPILRKGGPHGKTRKAERRGDQVRLSRAGRDGGTGDE